MDVIVSSVEELALATSGPYWELCLQNAMQEQFNAAREVCTVVIPDGVLSFVAKGLIAEGWRPSGR